MPQKTLHIFKAGNHTAMQGEHLAFSESDLAACAAAYNPSLHEAPLVVGHPTSDAPAYGWVQGLAATAEGLFATPQQVELAFAEAVSEGRFKKVSASFYKPDSPANPVQGVYYLRHVGFLGAQPPAVKGLKSVSFADSDADCVTVEFSEENTASIMVRMAGLFRSLRDYFIDKEGLEKADAIIPSWTADWLQEDAAIAAQAAAPSFQEPQPKEQPMLDPIPSPAVSGAPSALAANGGGTGAAVDPARVAQLEAQVASFQEAQRRHAAQSLVASYVAEGRVTPAQSTGLVEFMAGLSETADTVSFGEGQNASKLSQHSFMAAFLAKLPKQVDFGEQAADPHRVEGLSVQDAAREALCYQENLRKQGVVISTTDAVAAVKAGRHKETTHG